MAIMFYRINEEYGCFSNFARYGFELEGKYWITSEHYFQAKKFEGTEYEEKIRLAPTPMEAAQFGRNRKKPIRLDWEEVKDDVMRKAVLKKFQTHTNIKEMLLLTADEEIVEKTINDYYWGCGEKGNGRNMLGKILMEVRQLIRDDI